ncbi:Sec-independent protein translocase subunit TatA/TatB [Breznakiella homolactica]|uniref:Sec-independent protein translocase protein TatB n=1 Tax=Breznakiella homolactica TaxID=2798577 RepID=A0A7T7XP94_9SPIR|nr:hypothetical protein [Breznakiella homolactica]QQO10000.1 hypothetical protein JFL75_03545 [Breznakiella homolactica]
MFGIGFSEILIICLILIVFIKPEDLPKFFRSAGRLYGKFKKTYNEVIAVKDKIIQEIDEAASLDEKKAAETAAKAAPADAPKAITDTAAPASENNPVSATETVTYEVVKPEENAAVPAAEAEQEAVRNP